MTIQRHARIKEKFSTPRKLRTRTQRTFDTMVCSVRGHSRCSFYDGNYTYTYRPRIRTHCGVRHCYANLQIFRCKPSATLLCESYKYSALLPHGVSMQTCRYLCIVRASTSENVFTRSAVSIGLPTIYAFSIFVTLMRIVLTCEKEIIYQFSTRYTSCTIDRIGRYLGN